MQDTQDAPEGPPQEEELLELPRNVLVACPLAHPRATRMDQCPACPNFRGLEDRFGPGSVAPFATRYLLKCAAPRKLTLTEFIECPQ